MEKFDFDEFMGIVTFMIEEEIEPSLIKDMRLVIEKKVEQKHIEEYHLHIFDWYIKNFLSKQKNKLK